jgi:signal transduction histidine kinase
VLAVLMGAIRIAEHHTQEPKTLEMLHEAAAAAERGRRIAEQLLGFARHEERVETAFDVNRAILDLQPLVARSLGLAIRTDLDLHPDPLVITANRDQFELVLLNLAANARDAMPSGGRLRIRTGLQAAGGGQVHIAVADTGVGMSAEVMARAFEPYFTTKAKGSGTGLGLPMIRDFVEASRGSISIESEPGRGTTVHMRFPLTARTEPVLADGPAPRADPAG